MSNKVRQKKVVKHEHTFAEGADVLIKKMQAFGENWGKKFAEYESKLQQFSAGVAKQISVMFQNVQALAVASSAHDASILAVDKVLLEAFAQLQQMDTLLSHLTTPEQRAEWLNEDEIREKTTAWYQHLTKTAFERVNTERQARLKAQQEAAKKLAEEQAKAQEAKKEEDQVAAAVQQAEAPQVASPESGGEGADIPEGAQVFGG
jgi:hypothetical protein